MEADTRIFAHILKEVSNSDLWGDRVKLYSIARVGNRAFCGVADLVASALHHYNKERRVGD